MEQEMAEQIDHYLVQQPITETIEQNYMPYAMSVIVSRAIPEIDGFKPSHRKLLFMMYRMGLLNGPRTKSANVVGQTMKLNPHGDQAIYETLVRLSRGNGALLHPYVDSKGNFGRQYSRDMHYAAARYTEVRLDRICSELFRGLDKNSVDFVDNYDNTLKEPVLLPTTFPSILVNNNQGIAVGMASNICSFNLSEVCQAAIAYIQDPAADLMDAMPAPDFSTGAELIYNAEEMDRIYRTGRGSVTLRAVYRIDKKNSVIEILEIPYTTTAEAIIDEVTGLVKQGKIKEITDIRDETDLNGLKIAFEFRRTADPEALMQKLFRFTSLQSNFACNFNVLINGTPRVLGVRGLLGEWLSWRRSCVRREIAYDIEQKQQKLHLLRGLEQILLDIDRAIRIIRQSDRESDVVPNLMQGFQIDEIQAEHVADIRLKYLNRQYILQRTADIQSLIEEIADLQNMLENRERVDNFICDILRQVAQRYGAERKTRLIHEQEVAVFDDEELIEDFRLRLFLTEHGYLKKLALTSLRSAGELKTKEEDQIVQDIEGKNKMDVLFFSNQGNCYKMKCFDIEDHKPSDLGAYTPNLLNLEEDERILFIHVTEDYSGQILIGYENGKFSKMMMNVYETKTNRRKLVNAFSVSSPAVGLFFLDGEDDFAAVSNINKGLVFSSQQVPLKTTRSNQGVQVMLSKKGSVLVSVKRLSESNIEEDQYYRCKKLPAAGKYLKESTLVNRQLDLNGL